MDRGFGWRWMGVVAAVGWGALIGVGMPGVLGQGVPGAAATEAVGVRLTITSPGDELTGLFINQTAEMAVTIEHGKPPSPQKGKDGPWYNYAGKSMVPANYTVAWTSTLGSFTESYAPTTTFMNVSDLAGPEKLFWMATAIEENEVPAKPAAGATGPARVPGSAPGVPASGPDRGPKALLGHPEAMFLPEELQKEIAVALAEPNRDARVERLRSALAQRPADPWGIVLAFHIATQLGQNTDEEHHQGVHPEESLAVLKEIVGRYDHKVYYNVRSIGETCSPQLMVPRAAIMAASIETGYLHDRAAGRDLAVVALTDLDWTFRARTQDWINAPMPAPLPPGLGGPMEEAKYDSRVAAWEKEKRDAGAGRAVGPYERELAEAAVRQYGLSMGPQRAEEVAAVMQPLIASYPKSPIAAAAQTHIERAKALLAPAPPAGK